MRYLVAILPAACTSGCLLPTGSALVRRMPARPARVRFSINLLLGWTFVGWIVALMLAFGESR